jgi:UDP-N-acetylmuramyl pentapeptide phosphotransferase/UDP-N-acetylglucosamine-1-phosphate transferase
MLGLCTFVSLLVAAVVLTQSFGQHPGWPSFQRFSGVLTLVMVCGFLFVFATNAVDALDGLFGVAQRFFVGSAILWQFLVAARANQLAGDQVAHVVTIERASV